MSFKINLMEDSIGKEEKGEILDCLEKGRYTQGEKVFKFEREFANWNGSKYAVMVNSGSSANLLMINYLKEFGGLSLGDEILVPSVTWPTTIYPIIQNGLNPVLCDVDESFNMSIDSIKKMTNENTKGIFLVHLLGQPAKVEEIKKFCLENKLSLIEDCCESLGAQKGGKKVGNFGNMGSFSFYFGHHMTTIEGGMIVTDNPETYDLLKSMRSHGWIRGTEREGKYPEFYDKSFVFDILGYNLRSTDLNAGIGLEQLKKVDEFIKIRKQNHKYFLDKLDKLDLETQKINIDETSSFSLPILLNDSLQKEYVLRELKKYGIESRMLVAGNMARQPVFKDRNIKKDNLKYSDKIHNCGIYLPNNQFINPEKIDYMISSLESILKDNSNLS